MKLSVSHAWLFPLTICGFAAAGVSGLDAAFTTTTRWLGLLLLALFLLHRRRLLDGLRLSYAPALVGWLIWNIATTFWSEQPALSLVKSLAMALTVITVISGGLYWVRSRPGSPLSYLAPLAGVALFAGLAGSGGFVWNNVGVRLYRGVSTNANYLGVLAAVGLAYPLYALHRSVARRERAVVLAFWLLVAVVLAALLWLSGSRAAALAAAPLVLAFAVAATPRRIARRSAVCALFVVSAALLSPAKVTTAVSRPIMSFADKGRPDVFFSRRPVWTRSAQAAREGGVAGLGFGVNAGAPANFQIGRMTTSGYTRLKANSQLATIEETGLIGLAAYGIVLIQLFSALFAGLQRVDRDLRVALSLVIGLLCGLVVHSIFEGWGTSPGSMETVLFWATAGVGGGLLRLPRLRDANIRPAESS